MSDVLTELLARAERVIPGAEATQALGEVRAQLEEEHGRALIYEVVAPASGDWIDGRAVLFSDYLDARRFGPLGGPAVRLALWVGESMYLIGAADFFRFVAERRGIELAELEKELRARLRSDAN